MTDNHVSNETLSDGETSRHNLKNHPGSRPSISSQKSERKIGDSSSSSRRESRRFSRLSETITVISDCARVPDTCVLCGSGIPFSKCICCENEAHNRCIGAFFCTTGRRVNLDHWRCPKCVTISNMHKERREEKEKDGIKAVSEVNLLEPPVVDTGCPFCKINADNKNCKCRECVGCLKKCEHIHQTQRTSYDKEGKPPMLKYNKCLQYRDLGTKIDYKYLEEEDRIDEEEDVEDSTTVKLCWSFTWFLLLITFAFPIAIICAPVFIIIYCFNACSICCHPACCFFLEGIKLPGTCCRGICSGDPMCSSKDDAKGGKY